jgi:C-terminal processing protease CtpA/Prc
MMYEDDTSAEDQAQVAAMSNLAAQGGSGIDFLQLGNQAKLPGLLQALYTQQLSALDKQEAGDKERFEAGEARIRERYRGPTQSEQLFMLSKALLAPRKYTGIGGTIGKISGAFGDISAAERKARDARDAQLAQFQDAYMEKSDGYGVKRAQTAADLVKTAAPLLKAPTLRSALNSRDEVVNLNTAEIINAPPPPVGTIKTGRDGRKYRFTNITRDNDQYNKANWQEVK